MPTVILCTSIGAEKVEKFQDFHRWKIEMWHIFSRISPNYVENSYCAPDGILEMLIFWNLSGFTIFLSENLSAPHGPTLWYRSMKLSSSSGKSANCLPQRPHRSCSVRAIELASWLLCASRVLAILLLFKFAHVPPGAGRSFSAQVCQFVYGQNEDKLCDKKSEFKRDIDKILKFKGCFHPNQICIYHFYQFQQKREKIMEF